MGYGVNRWLMLCFLQLSLLGAIAAGCIAVEHRLRPQSAKSLRNVLTWLHILIFWPLPLLLAFHVFKVYWF